MHPLGEARPGWKVLRVLGSLLGVAGFELDTIEEVRRACLAGRDVARLLSNGISPVQGSSGGNLEGVQRIADVPIYFSDPIVRRSAPLQKTKDAQPPKAWMNARLMARLGISKTNYVLVKSGSGSAKLVAALDERLPDECVRIAAGHASTAELGPMFGTVTLERIAAERAA